MNTAQHPPFARTVLRKITQAALPLITLTALTPASHAQHDAHVHGEAEMTIAWVDQTLVIELDTPAYNLFGKPTPQNDADFAKLDALKAGQWFKFVEDINCPLTTAELQHPFKKGDHEDEHEHEEKHEEHHDNHDDEHKDDHKDEHHDEHHDEHKGEGHNDVEVSLTYRCADDPSALDFSALFAANPELHEIKVQWLTGSQQSAAKLHADEAVLQFN